MKKIPLFLAAAMVLTGSLTGEIPAMARSPEDADWPVKIDMTPNVVLQDQFLINAIRPKYNGYSFKFNGEDPNFIIQGRTRYGVWNAYLAAYDYNKVTQAEVESRIAELGETGGNPSWAKWTHTMANGIQSGISSGMTRFNENGIRTAREAPGVLYYGLQLRDNKNSFDDPEYFWVYGKLDFRACAYNAATTPHILRDCQVTVSKDGKHYEYRPLGGATIDPDTYVEWSEEWGGILNERLSELETAILAWTGDEEEEQGFRTQFQDTRVTAADADGEAQILATVDRLEELLNLRSVEVEEQQRLEEQKRLEEEQKRLEEEQKKLEEEKAKQEEERARLEEEKKRQEEEQQRLEEEQKLLEEEKNQQEAEQKRLEEEQLRLEEEKKKQEEEQKRLDEENQKQEEEQRQLAEEKQKLEEERKRLDEEKKQLEEQKRQEEEKKQEISNHLPGSRPGVNGVPAELNQGSNEGMGSANASENGSSNGETVKAPGTDLAMGGNAIITTTVARNDDTGPKVDINSSAAEKEAGSTVEALQKKNDVGVVEDNDEIELPALQSTVAFWKVWLWPLVLLFVLTLGTVLYKVRKKLQKQ